MLQKNSSYWVKTGSSVFLKLLKMRSVQLFIVLFLFVYTSNCYEFKKEDALMMRSLGNYYLMDQVKTISKKHKLDPLLVTSVILSESSAYSFAVSYMNAKGLMQLMPETALAVAKGMKNGMYDKIKENPGLIYDPSINIELAVIHLKGMYQFVAKKQWDSALHIYNLSSYAFKKGQRNHSYVDGILKRVKKWKG